MAIFVVAADGVRESTTTGYSSPLKALHKQSLATDISDELIELE